MDVQGHPEKGMGKTETGRASECERGNDNSPSIFPLQKPGSDIPDRAESAVISTAGASGAMDRVCGIGEAAHTARGNFW